VTRGIAIAALALLAGALRLPRLEQRPMHADEAILADKFGTFLATGHYVYAPLDYHGPMLAYCTLLPAYLSGRTSYARLNEPTLRIVPATAGILLALSPLLFTSVIGFAAAWLAAAFLTVSPAMVYYSRDYIPEMLLALWAAAWLWTLWKTLRRPGPGGWALAGCIAGMMLATKETAVLVLASSAIAGVVVFRPRRPDWRSAGAFAATLALTVSALLAPPWRWGLLGSAAQSYLHRGVAPGWHAHPWHYYLGLLTGAAGGPGEALLFILAMAGFVIAFRSDKPVLRFVAWYGILLAGLYSALPYKTPWCIVAVLYPFALLAGVAAESLVRLWRAAALVLVAAAMTYTACQAWLASTRYSSDPRNQWVYAQTGNGVYKIRDRVEACAQAAAQGRQVPVDIYSRENLWPLPWYLRGYPNVRWWREVPAQGLPAPILLASPAMEPDLIRKLYESPPPGERVLYMQMFPGYVELRPGVEVRGYVSKQLWDRMEQRP
jgi:predicted membrane-bound mannosyltransferase